MESKQKIIIICGPTASGKTGLALQLAKVLPQANILSVDSRQVYKSLDVISGKDIPDNLSKEITIFGHDLFNPDETANLADFVRYSQKIIHDSGESNTPLIIVGGTGLYLKAITQNLSNVLIPPNQKLRQELEKLSLSALQELLKKEDPKKFIQLNHSDLMNPRRLIRAIEIARSTITVSSSSLREGTPTKQSPHFFRWIGLVPDKTILKRQIHQRVLARLKADAIDEVKNLIKKYPDRKLPIYTSLGVSQIIDFIDGKISKDQMVEIWTNAEVDYARRQIIWFKKQPDIVWYDNDEDRNTLIEELKKYIQNA